MKGCVLCVDCVFCMGAAAAVCVCVCVYVCECGGLEGCVKQTNKTYQPPYYLVAIVDFS